VLASSKARVQSLLWQLPSGLQNAFYNAFFSMIKHFLPDSDSQLDGDPAITWRLLTEWEAEGKPRSSVTDTVRLQTLVMAAISVDFHGATSTKVQISGPSKTEILGRAVGLGYSMNLYRRQIDPDPSSELDPNSDDNVALRAWWVLVMLDRWNALGMAKPPLVADQLAMAQPGLKHIAGDVVYALIRMSYILALVMPITVDPIIDPLSQQGVHLSRMATGITHLMNWVFPTEHTNIVLDLTYWHIRLMSELSSPDLPQRPGNILQATKFSVGLLVANHGLLTPVTHHFMTLAALGVIELQRFADTRDEADRLTKEVLESSIAASPWNVAVRDRLSEYQARLGAAGQVTTTATDRNLQQLADLATAVDGSGAPPTTAPPATAAQDGHQPVAAAASSASVTKPEQNGEDGHAQHRQEQEQEQQLVDVRAVLTQGYLTWFDEPLAKDGEVVVQ